MAAHHLDELLRLPPDERAALARALWESLTESDRERLGMKPPVDTRAAERHEGPRPLSWHQVRHVMQGGD